MTAINVIRRDDRIWFMTDAAVYSQTGVIEAIEDKVILLPAIGAAIATRGPYENFRVLQYMLNASGDRLKSFDDLVEQLPAIIRGATARFHRDRFELTIGGYSGAREGMETYLCFSRSAQGRMRDGMGTIPEAVPVRVPDLVGSPIPAPHQLAAVGIFGPISPEEFDPRTDGMRLMEGQRLYRHSTGGYHMVGGYAQLTTITREGLTSEVLRSWPDRIGHKIDLSRDAEGFVGEVRAQATVNALNRQQRRALKAARRPQR
ncbi:hypothetical protein ASD04_17865 [Devosia sp. Root436]|uniref:hypothetical protein n=1 Tax=Devosia sp. Root436 TaxID=1736537 RepID=UPI0006F7C4AE|nr:hypothetical protein [Devosia sp. Root436]KQX34108.1 hypothetical protein ASD04_17865 [Devosia sp. Root436]